MDMQIELHGHIEMEKDYQYMIQKAKKKDNWELNLKHIKKL